MRMIATSIAYLLLFTLFSASCEKGGKTGKAPEPSDKNFSQSKVETQRGKALDLIKIHGVFAPSHQVQIKSGFDGHLLNLSAREGQAIAKGAPLFTIDDGELPLVLAQQRAELKEAEEQQSSASLETPAETPEEESVGAGEESEAAPVTPAEPPPRPALELSQAPAWTPPSGYREPVPGLPEDAGGVWPQVRITENYAAMSSDPQDAGGIWPDYGPRRRVMGDEEITVVEPEYAGNRMSYSGSAYRPLPRRPTVVVIPPPEASPAVAEISPAQEQAANLKENQQSLDQARIDRIKADIAITESQLASRTYLSPIEGLVQTVTGHEGEVVKPDDPIVELIQVDPIELTLKVPVEKISMLERGTEADVNVADLPGQSFRGEVSFIGAKLEDDMKSVEVRVRVANPDLTIKPGMEGTAQITVARKS